jgi:hypothetical protein
MQRLDKVFERNVNIEIKSNGRFVIGRSCHDHFLSPGFG